MRTTQRIAIQAAALSIVGTGAFAYGTWDLIPWWIYPLTFVALWTYLHNGWVKGAAQKNMANMMDRS